LHCKQAVVTFISMLSEVQNMLDDIVTIIIIYYY